MTVVELKRFLENSADDAELVLAGESGEPLQVWECWNVEGTPHFTFASADAI